MNPSSMIKFDYLLQKILGYSFDFDNTVYDLTYALAAGLESSKKHILGGRKAAGLNLLSSKHAAKRSSRLGAPSTVSTDNAQDYMNINNGNIKSWVHARRAGYSPSSP